MDIQKLRPTHSQWHYPLLTVEECRSRGAPKPFVAVAKPLAPTPKGRGNALWQKFHDNAVAQGLPNPEKLADAFLRSRERTLEIEAKRHKVQVTTHTPRPEEAAAVAPKRAKPVLHDSFRCKALTLEGRRCGFKATCGDFCKKHAVAEKM